MRPNDWTSRGNLLAPFLDRTHRDPPPICRNLGAVETASGAFRERDDAEGELKEQAIDIGANFLVVGEQGTERDPINPTDVE